MKSPKICLIFGTRPEIIKLSPLMRLFERERVPYFMIHTGQHYSYAMDKLFFKELELPSPKYRLDLRSKGASFQSHHVARMMIEIEEILLREKPRHVLVQGDTNTVMAGALVVSKLSVMRELSGVEISLGHVEAGLRSYDDRMPEEINRRVTDHISHHLFAPTPLSRKILLGEKIEKRRIHVTGNTIVDAVLENRKLAARKSDVLARWGLKPRGYALVTMHRQENVDDEKRLRHALEGVSLAAKAAGVPAVFPMHPRTAKQMKRFDLELPANVTHRDPVGFLDFLSLEANAKLLLTDSGGVQEEGMILGVPCVTLRETTERPETVIAGANVLAGVDPKKIAAAAKKMTAKKAAWKNTLGDGRAARRILDILMKAR